MKKIYLLLILLSFLSIAKSHAQSVSEETVNKEMKKWKPKLGIKFGYNVARLTGSTPNFSPQTKNGFNASAFYELSPKGIGYRTEIIFSRQGFSFDDNGQMQNVQQDYAFMSHLTTLTIAKILQLQAGGQIGYLLNAKKQSSTPATEQEQVMEYMKRFDYGAAVGVEVYPYKGIILGCRYNISMGSPYKDPGSVSASPIPLPFPFPVNPTDFKGKNAVIQFSIGYKF